MRALTTFALAAVLAGASVAAAAQSSPTGWPTKPVHAVIPYTAGSAIDSVARIVFEQLAAQLGQPIVVENRSGAGGTIGTGFVAKSEPDGYTVLVNSAAHAISPSLFANLSFDTARDLAAVIPLGGSPNVLVIAPHRGIATIQEMVAAAKAKPGSFTYATLGVGTSAHLSAERFRASAGFDAVHIPFKGGPEGIMEVMGGRVDFSFGAIGIVLSNIREGKLLALVTNGYQRSRALPDVPTTAEAGFPNAENPIWFGTFVPARTPAAIVDRLHDETAAALATPAVEAKLAALGIEPMPMTPAAFDGFVKAEIVANAALIKALGISAR